MTRLLRAAVLLVAVLALAGATGCFGSNSDENAYVDQFNKVQRNFAITLTKAHSVKSDFWGIVNQARSGAPFAVDAKAQAIQSFDTLENANATLIAELKAVDPPAKVESLHKKLIRETHQFEAQVEKAAVSFTASDGPAIEAAVAQFATDAGESRANISKTISEINDKLRQ